MRVEDAEAAIKQEQKDSGTVETAEWTTRKPEQMFEQMMVAIRDSLSNLACSHNAEGGEDEDDEGTEQGKVSEDDKPGWVMGTISKTVQQWM